MPDTQTSKPSRIVLVSAYFPPTVGGTSTVLANLVSRLAPEDVIVVTEKRQIADKINGASVPEGIKILETHIPPTFFQNIPYIWRWERSLRFALIPKVMSLTLRAIRETKATCIVAVYPSWPFLIGAYLAHRHTGLPLVTYHMDIPVRRSSAAAFEGFFIDKFERKIALSAQKRLIISEGLVEDFRSRLGLDSTIIPHSIDLDATSARLATLPGPDMEGETRIVHTGIVEGQRECLLRIARTLHNRPGLDARLILCTPTPKARLLQAGFDLPSVEIISLPQEKVLPLQASAHILTTVLPFFLKTKEGALTCFPTKLVEYLATNRPILIHSPAWSFLARNARQHDYAEVVDQPNEDALANAIWKLRQDPALRSRISQNASDYVRDFDIHKVTRQFQEACNL